jgi:hypothetical protein
MAGVLVGITAKTAQFKAGLDKAQGHAKSFRKKTQAGWKRVGDSIKGSLATAALGGGTFALVLDRILTGYDSIAKKARQAGMDPETFQRQQHAFEKAGVGVDEYTAGVVRMGRKLAEAKDGNEAITEAMRRLNLNVEEFAALSPDKQVLALADAYANAGDKQEAFAALFKLLEDDAKKFKLAFEGGAAAINDSGDALKNVMTAEQLESIEKMNNAMADFKKNISVVVATWLPQMLELLNQLLDPASKFGAALRSAFRSESDINADATRQAGDETNQLERNRKARVLADSIIAGRKRGVAPSVVNGEDISAIPDDELRDHFFRKEVEKTMRLQQAQRARQRAGLASATAVGGTVAAAGAVGSLPVEVLQQIRDQLRDGIRVETESPIESASQ